MNYHLLFFLLVGLVFASWGFYAGYRSDYSLAFCFGVYFILGMAGFAMGEATKYLFKLIF